MVTGGWLAASSGCSLFLRLMSAGIGFRNIQYIHVFFPAVGVHFPTKTGTCRGTCPDIDWRLPEPIALNMLHASVLVINQLSPTWGPSERDQTGTQHHSLQEDKGQFDDREDGTKVVFLQLLKKQSYWYLRKSPLHQSPRYCNWPPLFLGGCVRLLFVGVCWASISLATSRANCPELRWSSQKTSVRKPEMVSL